MQFRLSTFIAFVTVAAVFCAIFFAFPLVLAVPLLGLIVLVSPSVWICGACFATGGWRAFFLGGICAGWLPYVCLLYVTLMAVPATFAGSLGEYTRAVDASQSIPVRLMVAAGFMIPGLIACLGGACGALVYRWFGVQPVKPAAESRLNEPYVVLESRVTPLPREASQQVVPASMHAAP